MSPVQQRQGCGPLPRRLARLHGVFIVRVTRNTLNTSEHTFGIKPRYSNVSSHALHHRHSPLPRRLARLHGAYVTNALLPIIAIPIVIV